MAWTTARTWVAGELVTAAIGNTHWRDNLQYLHDVDLRILDYATATSPALTNAGTLQSLVTGASVTYPAKRLWVEFVLAKIVNNGNTISVHVFEDSTDLGEVTNDANATAAEGGPHSGFLARTPSAAAHTYSIRASATSGGGNPTVAGLCQMRVLVEGY